jgi:hypothetical protein
MLAGSVTESACEQDGHHEDRRDRRDARESERSPAADGFGHQQEQQRSAEDSGCGDSNHDQGPPSGRRARDAHSRTRFECPEGELGGRGQSGREERCRGIEPSADESDSVPDAEQCQPCRYQRSTPDDETAAKERNAREDRNARRPGLIAGRQAHREREERGAGE